MSGGRHTLYFSTRCRHSQAFLEELMRTPFTREIAAVCVDPSPSRPPLPAWLKSVPTLMLAGAAAPLVGPMAVNNWLFERKMGGGSSASGGGVGAVPGVGSMSTDRRAPLAVPVYNPDLSARPSAPAGPPASMAMRPPASTTPMIGASGKLPPAVSGSTEAEKGIGPPTLAGSATDGPQGYHEQEMGGFKEWSDMYSFLSHPGYSEGKGVNPILKNFASLMDFGGAGGAGAAGGAGGAGAAAAPKRSAKEEALLAEFEAYTAKRDAGIAPGIKRM